MPFSSGTFNRLYNWVSDVAAGILIRADRMDSEMNGMATGLSTCLLKDGTQTVTANIPFAGFRLTGIGAATVRTDAFQTAQSQDGGTVWVAAGGTSDIITATYTPNIAALVDGMELRFRAAAANTTTTPTFSPNSLTAHTVTKFGGSALVANDIKTNQEVTVRYNLANTRWEILSPSTGAGALLAANNLSDVANASTALSNLAGAPLASPAFTGTPSLPTGATGVTQAVTDNSTKLATTAFVKGLFNPITNSLSGDVALNNTGNYFDGPSIAQGTSGTWFVSGSVTVIDTAGAATMIAKLWDGTTVIASTAIDIPASKDYVISLSGYIASPAANLRISVKDSSANTGAIKFNYSGNSKDSTITAIRIA